MIADVNVFGVFINGGLVTALAAFVMLLPVRRLLAWATAYRLVWHPALFDIALFVILWGLVAFLLSGFPGFAITVLG